MIREALRRYMNPLAAQRDAQIYQDRPLSAEELSLVAVEDWSDWADATR